MKAGKFYPVPYMGHLEPDVQELMEVQGGLIAYARWHILLGFMYEYDGAITLTDTRRNVLARNLQLDGEGLDSFLASCAEIGLIDAGFLDKGKVTSNGVQGQVDFKKTKADAGRKSGEARRNSV